jgi:hypothetical protein
MLISFRQYYNGLVSCGANMWRGRFLSTPSVVFASTFVLLGWITSHSIAYTLVGFMPHNHQEGHMHGYLDVLKLAGGCGLVLAFSLALRTFFRYGSFGEWLHEGGTAGTRKQVAIVSVLPAAVFVLAEHLERLLAGTGTYPSTLLLVVGVLAQLTVGLLCLAVVRVTFRVAERVIHAVARRRPVRSVRRATGPVVESALFVRPSCPMASSAAGRAPPFSIILR